ncbi:MAG: nitroreductase family protein [Pseudomonadota bacterium]
MTASVSIHAARTPDTEVDAQFPRRWSPRAMAATSLSQGELRRLLEAARWAPSCFNEQPWEVACALRETDAFKTFLEVLVPGNQGWAQHAGALLAFAARTQFTGHDRDNDCADFDTGAAWMSLALEASRLGLVAHAMRGFDMDAARAALRVPDDWQLLAFVAIGAPGPLDVLDEAYREREVPSTRRAVDDFLHMGRFSG